MTKNNNEEILYRLDASFEFIKKNLDENRQEIKGLMIAIDSINKNLVVLSNVQEKLNAQETKIAVLQKQFTGFKEETGTTINEIKDKVQDISERMHSAKKLYWLVLGAIVTIAANIISITFKWIFR